MMFTERLRGGCGCFSSASTIVFTAALSGTFDFDAADFLPAVLVSAEPINLIVGANSFATDPGFSFAALVLLAAFFAGLVMVRANYAVM